MNDHKWETENPPDYQPNPGLTLVKASRKDIAWITARRVAKGAFWGGASTFVATRDLTSTAIGAIIGGVGMGAEKLNKENRKAKGKVSLADVLQKITETIKLFWQYWRQGKNK